MEETVSTSTRVLGLLIELLGAERPRTKTRLRRLVGYAGLGEAAFESQFQRDKAALREAGVLIEVTGSPEDSYRVDPSSFAAPLTPLDDTELALIQLAVSAWRSAGSELPALPPKIAASSSAAPTGTAPLALGLEGAETVARIVEAIRERRILGFEYRSDSGAFERAVEPWRLILRGRALYLWGRDLDRDEERLFRLSRFASEVGFLGGPGDAGPVPEGLADPFDRLMVTPLLALRPGGARGVRAFVEPLEESDGAGWETALGEGAERGEWITRILSEAEDVVVLEPGDLRDELYRRITAAAEWGSRA